MIMIILKTIIILIIIFNMDIIYYISLLSCWNRVTIAVLLSHTQQQTLTTK